MGITERRCANFFLSLTVLLLGVTCTVLLYFAGQDAVDLFWGETATYKDELGRINRWVVTDDWYGLLVLRGWAFGFLYVVPGLTGLTAALFYNRLTMIVHFIVAIFVLVPGGVLHSVGAVGLVMYRLLVAGGANRQDPWLGDCVYGRLVCIEGNGTGMGRVNFTVAIFVLVPGGVLHSVGAVGLVMYRLLVAGGASRQDPWLGDCVYGRDYDGIPLQEDLRCTLGRRALTKAIAAVAVLFVAWMFVLAHVVYAAFTFSSVTKHGKKRNKPKSMPNENSQPLHEIRVADEPTQHASGSRRSSEQASGSRRGSSSTRPYRRGKRVAPPVPPQSSTNQTAAEETPRPSTSAEINENDMSTKQPKTSDETPSDQTEGSRVLHEPSLESTATVEDVPVDTPDVTMETPDDTGESQKQPIIDELGSNGSQTTTFVNPGFERL